MAELAPHASIVIATRSRHPRSVEPNKLAAEFWKWGIKPEVAEDITSAVELALARATPRDLICATGSIFVVAEVMEYMPSLS